MKVLRLVGGPGSGKSQSLASIMEAGWYRDDFQSVNGLMLVLSQRNLDNLGNRLDKHKEEDLYALFLDVEAELSPKAQQRLIQVAEAHGIQHLFLAYQG